MAVLIALQIVEVDPAAPIHPVLPNFTVFDLHHFDETLTIGRLLRILHITFDYP